MEHLTKSSVLYLSNYENLTILGGFNPGTEYDHMGDFCDINDLKSLITEPKCDKIPENPTLLAFLKTISDISPVWERTAWLSQNHGACNESIFSKAPIKYLNTGTITVSKILC